MTPFSVCVLFDKLEIYSSIVPHKSTAMIQLSSSENNNLLHKPTVRNVAGF